CGQAEGGHDAGRRLGRARGGAPEPGVPPPLGPRRDSPLDLVLAPALLKGSKMDLVVEKATELGVTRIAPFTSRHTIGAGVRLERWRRIAVAAAKQSGRTRVPAVDAPLAFATL